MHMHPKRLGIAFITAGLLGTANLSARAVQLSDGSTAFVQPPRLEGASVSQNAAYFFGARYYFTLTLPNNAGEPLQSITISPDPNVDYARFDPQNTKAYEGTRHRSETRLPIQTVAIDPKTRVITVTFDPPVAPGKTITLELFANRNPDTGGVYLYGVTAFPAGTQPRGQFLGYGRINIYDSRFDSFR
jgi:hypothetical protein